MKRKILALGCGVVTGILIGSWFPFGNDPLFQEKSSRFFSQTLFVLLLGAGVAGITSLISWKHTPGLPGMAYSLTLATMGMVAKPLSAIAAADRWLQATIVAILVLGGFLFAYLAAWAVDVYLVFPALPVRPPAKQIGWKQMVIHLLPCCFLTGFGAVIPILWLPFPLPASVFLGFFVSAFAASILFQTPSTLWYALAGPLCFVGLGMAALWKPGVFVIGNVPMETLCGLSSAAALAGHWLWAGMQKPKT